MQFDILFVLIKQVGRVGNMYSCIVVGKTNALSNPLLFFPIVFCYYAHHSNSRVQYIHAFDLKIRLWKKTQPRNIVQFEKFPDFMLITFNNCLVDFLLIRLIFCSFLC